MREREGGQRFLIHALKEKKKKRSLLFFFPIFRPLPPSIRLVFFKMYVMRLWLSLLVLSLSSGRFFFLRRVILCVCVFLFYFASLSSSLFSIPFCVNRFTHPGGAKILDVLKRRPNIKFLDDSR